MSFLTPFYLLAGLAVMLPIAFHLIRRTPQGRQIFGSVMFLSPSPPRMTKRSRIEDWLLLLLRGLAICLLAFAFARPFLQARSLSDPAPEKSARISILLDCSASMQRPGYWERAQQQLASVVRAAEPQDVLQIQTFDTTPHGVLTFAEWESMPVAGRAETGIQQVAEIQPGWKGTAAGQALIQAAEELTGDVDWKQSTRRIVLITDLQTGAGWDALQGMTWPDDLQVQVLDVSLPGETNAALQLAGARQDEQFTPRIRLSNATNSLHEAFQLNWKDEFTATPGGQPQDIEKEVYVAAGQSRIVPIPPKPADDSPQILVLSGDNVAFDNHCYLIPGKQRDVRIVFLGDAADTDPAGGLRFFLTPLFPSDATRTIEIIDWQGTPAPVGIPDSGPDWIIVGAEPDVEQLAWLKTWVRQGGEVLFVARNSQQAESLYYLLSLAPVPVVEAPVQNDAMLGRATLDHPALRQFDDPRFADFTKLRFWKYRKFDLASLPQARVLLAMEDGSPALMEISAGDGKVTVLAAGWNRDDSDLAVWSKFVPLMNSLLELAAPVRGPSRQMTVGDKLTLAELGIDSDQIAIRANSEISLHAATETFTFERPGIYRFADSRDELSQPDVLMIAVNLSPEESRTEPYPLELLAAAGLPLEVAGEDTEQAQRESWHQRQLLNRELESRQHWWRWLVLAGLAVLSIETLLAARTARAAARNVPPAALHG